MNEVVTILNLEFMQRALLGGVMVSLLAGVMGVLMVLKRASFFSDAIAHASLTGVALGVILGVDPVIAACVYAVLIALVLPKLEEKSMLPIDSLLGFILPFSMGLGVILLSLLPGYRPELMSFLFGSILAIGWKELLIVGTLAVVVMIMILRVWRKMVFVAFDQEYAKISSIKVNRYELWFNVFLAITVVVGIRLVGIVLINALLVIPASMVRLVAKNMKTMLLATPFVSVVITIAGLILSVMLDIPSGPAIAVIGGVGLIGMVGLRALRS